MLLIDCLKQSYGLDVVFDGAPRGMQLAEALYRALVDAGRDYAEQRQILFEATQVYRDLDFGNACLDKVESIAAFERRRGQLSVPKVRNRVSGVPKNKDWAMGAEYADLRFSAARPVDADSAASVEGMIRQLLAAGYIEQRPEVVLDLRQGLDYYLLGEDVVRQRRTVKWLKGQNESGI